MAALAVAAKAHDVMKVHHVLTDPSKDVMQNTVQAMGIVTTGQWGPCKARSQVEAKRQAVQWIDGSDKTGNNGDGDEDLGVKPHEDKALKRRGALQLEVQELELEQQLISQGLKNKIQEAPPDTEEVSQEAPQDPAKETKETPPDPAKETRQAPSDRKEETREAPWDSVESIDPDEKTREAPLNPEKGTQKALPDPEEETREVPLNPGQETRELPSDRKTRHHRIPTRRHRSHRWIPRRHRRHRQIPRGGRWRRHRTPRWTQKM